MAFSIHRAKIKINRNSNLEEDNELIYPGEIVIALADDDKTVIGIKAGYGDEEHIDADYSIDNYTDDGLARPMPDAFYKSIPFVSMPWKILGEASQQPDPQDPQNPQDPQDPQPDNPNP